MLRPHPAPRCRIGTQPQRDVGRRGGPAQRLRRRRVQPVEVDRRHRKLRLHPQPCPGLHDHRPADLLAIRRAVDPAERDPAQCDRDRGASWAARGAGRSGGSPASGANQRSVAGTSGASSWAAPWNRPRSAAPCSRSVAPPGSSAEASRSVNPSGVRSSPGAQLPQITRRRARRLRREVDPGRQRHPPGPVPECRQPIGNAIRPMRSAGSSRGVPASRSAIAACAGASPSRRTSWSATASPCATLSRPLPRQARCGAGSSAPRSTPCPRSAPANVPSAAI